MGKFTKKIPKPLLKVGKIPIIEHKINYYKSQGFKNLIFLYRLQSKQNEKVF